MSCQKIVIVLISCWYLGYNNVQCRRGFMLTFPQELQIGANEKFCVTMFPFPKEINLRLNITCFGRSDNRSIKSIRPSGEECFHWKLPETFTVGTCTIVVFGSDGTGSYNFSETKDIQLVDTHHLTFIQTDKPVYKPGNIVKFRILTVTQALLPVTQKIDSVVVHDPHDFYMKQWTELETSKGLTSLEYKLYEEPVLGKWKIVTLIGGRKTEQAFVVNQYVLPRFQVDTKLPSSLTVATKYLQFEVCTRYTFGKPVHGRMNSSVCLHNTEKSWFCDKNIRPCARVLDEIKGCHTFTIETKTLNLTARVYSLLCKPRLTLDVNITEIQTGVIVQKTVTGVGVWEERVKLKFTSQKHFKPYFPYYGTLFAWTPDGSAAVGEKITISISKLGITTQLTTDQTGHAYFTIQNLTHSTQYFTLKAKTLDPEFTDHNKYTLFAASTSKHVKQWYSPSSSYIQLSTFQDRPLHCRDTVTVDVVYSLKTSVSVQVMAYTILSKGNILLYKNITGQLTHSQLYQQKVLGSVLKANLSPVGPRIDDTPNNENLNSLPHGPPALNPGLATHPQGGPSQAGSPLTSSQTQDISKKDMKTQSKENKDDVKKVPDTSPPVLRHFTFQQYLSNEMPPNLRLLLFVLTDAGELIADTLEVNVDHCYSNQVKMTFDRKSARPGETVNLTISSSANSLCAVSLVDKGVYLYGGSNLMRRSMIDDRLASFDLTSDFMNDWLYCSNLSQLPPDMSNSDGPPYAPGSSVGLDVFDDNLPFNSGRMKRSIMQFYSNMYDSLIAFKTAGLVILTDFDLQTRPCLHSGEMAGSPHADHMGLVPGEIGSLDEVESSEEPIDTRDPVSTLRQHFPETWIWHLYQVTSSGSVTASITMPDTITEWLGNSVCISMDSGLGVSDVARITGFQPFFMEVKLPYSVIRGEIIKVDVIIFNYMSHCIALQVALNNNGMFQLETSNGVDNDLCLCAEHSKSVVFSIKPIVLGKMNLTFSGYLKEHRISCYGTQAPPGYEKKQTTETVVKELLVQAEGIEEEETISHFICPQGDIMGPVLSGIEDLIQLPTGCGEQNMMRMAPNIAILNYLTSTKQLTDDLETRILDYIYKGYQQQLNFMHKDGSFSSFGIADDAGSTWLSAFVFKTLQMGLDYIYVDRKQVLTKTWEFLVNQQGEDGCFIEKGKVISKYMMGGVAGSSAHKNRALTAYVLLAMLESFKMMRERTPPFVALAVKCIEAINITEDTYTHALLTYAMTLYKPNSQFTTILLKRLKQVAHIEGDTMHWRREKEPELLPLQGRAASAEIEITAYALLAILTHNDNVPVSEVVPIVRWLTQQRNAYGGFVSTQDTVIAMQALSMFALRMYGKGLDVNINVVNGITDSWDVHVTASNSIILQQYHLKTPLEELHITAKGDGCVLVQVANKYNVINKVHVTDSFVLSVTTPVTMETINNNCNKRTINVCVRYLGPDGVSNMAIVEIKLPSGWLPDIPSLQKLPNSVELGVKKIEIDKRYPDIVNFYFNELGATNTCFDVTVELEVVVQGSGMYSAKVFDYYETDFQRVVQYVMTPCTEDHLEAVDITIVDETDTPIEEIPVKSNSSSLFAKPSPARESVTDAAHKADMPTVSEPGCPHCVRTGTVSLLHQICQRQVWILEAANHGISVQTLTADGVSPEVQLSISEVLHGCIDCHTYLLEIGEKSLTVLNLHYWDDLTANLAQNDTLIVPWSMNLQLTIQEVMRTCSTNK